MNDMYDNYGPNGFLHTECDRCGKETTCKVIGPNGGVLAFCVTCSPSSYIAADITTAVYNQPQPLLDTEMYEYWHRGMSMQLDSYKRAYGAHYTDLVAACEELCHKTLQDLHCALESFDGTQSATLRDKALHRIEVAHIAADCALYSYTAGLVVLGATAPEEDDTVDYVDPSGPHTDVSDDVITCECGHTGRWMVRENYTNPAVGEYLQCPSCDDYII